MYNVIEDLEAETCHPKVSLYGFLQQGDGMTALVGCMISSVCAPDGSIWDISSGALRNEGVFEAKPKMAFAQGGADDVTGELGEWQWLVECRLPGPGLAGLCGCLHC